MKLALDRYEKLIREVVREFAKNELGHDGKEIMLASSSNGGVLEEIVEGRMPLKYLEDNNRFPWELLKKAGEMEYISPNYHFNPDNPDEILGTMMENVIVIEEMCKYPLGMTLTLASIPAYPIHQFGSTEQKEKYLKPVLKGEATFAIMATEPDHGSCLANLNTRAERLEEEESWKINGSKQFITNGTISNYGIVLCDTDDGKTMFIVDLKSKGVTTEEMQDKAGLPTSPTARVFLDNVIITAESILGEPGKGKEYMGKFLDESRTNIAAQAIGIAQGAYDLALKHAKERVQGRNQERIIDYQTQRDHLARMKVEIEAARRLMYLSARLIDEGKTDGRISAMAKYNAARVAEEVTRRACKIYGGYGFFNDQMVTLLDRDAKILPIYEGTEEMQLERIAHGGFKGLVEDPQIEPKDMEASDSLSIARQAVYLSEILFSKMVNYAASADSERKIDEDQVVRLGLSKTKTDIMAAKMLVQYATEQTKENKAKMLSLMAQYKACGVIVSVANEAVELFGKELSIYDKLCKYNENRSTILEQIGRLII